MNYKISHPTKNIKCLIDLPPSKSISNRLLIIKSLCKEDLKIKNLSLCDDTIVLKNGLKKNHGEIDIGHAGTSLRFLTAYFAIQKNREYILTGSNRVKERPIKELVDALRTLGAKIEYLQNEGFAPLKISGAELVGKEIEINGNISSQFISALLLVAPSIKNGLSLKIKGNLVSSSYINMTLRLMNYFGVKSTWKNKKIEIKEQNYMGREIQVEADWSSASFWYEIACISKKCNIVLKGLSKDSIQGDKVLTDIYSDFGVISNFDLNLLSLKKSNNFSYKKKINLIEFPDLYQPIRCTIFGLNLKTKLLGTTTLVDKETNRLIAMDNELKRIVKNKSIRTYDDHRMAMSFAPLSLIYDEVKIENIAVVSKSYKNFWRDLKKAGFKICPSID